MAEPNVNTEAGALQALKDIALESLREQRRARRWGIFFKLILVAYVTLLFFVIPACQMSNKAVASRHTAMITVDGIIMDGAPANAELLMEGLRKAFEAPNVAGVVIRINSPGGSPVQAGMVNNEIRRLRQKHPKVPVYAVVTDLCASGGYYVAAATDRIYVDKASLVGSIGVLMDSFGFTGTMEKLGVERRLYTAGEAKGFLDPFSPQREQEVAHVQTLLQDIHSQFVQVVKEGRGARLKDDPSLFTGLIWTGEQSIELGLADALGDVNTVAREVIGAERVVDYTPRMGFLSLFADRIGASAARHVQLQLRSKMLW